MVSGKIFLRKRKRGKQGLYLGTRGGGQYRRRGRKEATITVKIKNHIIICLLKITYNASKSVCMHVYSLNKNFPSGITVFSPKPQIF